MPINITSIESALQSKLNAATGSTESKEFLLLTKALESLNSGAVSEVATIGDLPTAADNTGRTLWVTAESGLYVSNGTTWSNLDPQAIIDGAPAALDTLNELAAALGDDANFASTVTNSIATKMPLAGGTFTGDVTFPDGDKALFGTGNDLQMYHDGSNSYILDNGTGVLFIDASSQLQLRSTAQDIYVQCIENSGVNLFWDNAKKLETTSLGVDITGELIADSYNETYAAVTSSSNATTVNCEAGNTFSHTLTENTTFTFSNPPASGTSYSMSVEIIQDAGASGFTVTWPTSVDFPAATAPTLTATASAVDVFVFTTRDGGTTWYGFTAGQALA